MHRGHSLIPNSEHQQVKVATGFRLSPNCLRVVGWTGGEISLECGWLRIYMRTRAAGWVGGACELSFSSRCKSRTVCGKKAMSLFWDQWQTTSVDVLPNPLRNFLSLPFLSSAKADLLTR